MMDLNARSKLISMTSEEKSMTKRFRFLDMLIDNLMDETLQRIETIIERKIPTQHVVLNASKVVMARRDQKNWRRSSITAGSSMPTANRSFGRPDGSGCR
ncbi:hypothetical protein QS257_18885 [Terrilactibacillus sp. S3-3]|nr:hypothetical protein QS257_18885 [Terrilactibacillus sp. S3-3]